jgi:ubiquinone/menaquinone biosynthesis C-methylase UbiE
MMSERKDNKSYYDEFAAWYERERGRGYHQLIDDLEVEVVERYSRGAAVLEAGCGTGLILGRIARTAGEAWGVDLSSGMLAKARERGLQVVQASVTDLPFPDGRFDVSYSFKVLAHVEKIREAVAEMTRVTRRGGYVVLEFYNPRSLRYLVKRLKPPSAISAQTSDEAVYTRYDDLDAVRAYLPESLKVVTMRGVRIATPSAFAWKVPGMGAILSRVERALADRPVFRTLGGFLIVVAQKS